MYEFKKDVYRQNRGNWSRVLDLSCHACSAHISYYQKDGPGILKRSYLDRFIDLKPSNLELFKCRKRQEVLGVLQGYKKENNRPSICWLIGLIDYKIIPIAKISRMQ